MYFYCYFLLISIVLAFVQLFSHNSNNEAHDTSLFLMIKSKKDFLFHDIVLNYTCLLQHLVLYDYTSLYFLVNLHITVILMTCVLISIYSVGACFHIGLVISDL